MALGASPAPPLSQPSNCPSIPRRADRTSGRRRAGEELAWRPSSSVLGACKSVASSGMRFTPASARSLGVYRLLSTTARHPCALAAERSERSAAPASMAARRAAGPVRPFALPGTAVLSR
jgi:hypothetical protein